jgi:hypothetical protein
VVAERLGSEWNLETTVFVKTYSQALPELKVKLSWGLNNAYPGPGVRRAGWRVDPPIDNLPYNPDERCLVGNI